MLVAWILAPGIAAPDESKTWPDIVARNSWAATVAAQTNANIDANILTEKTHGLDMRSDPFPLARWTLQGVSIYRYCPSKRYRLLPRTQIPRAVISGYRSTGRESRRQTCWFFVVALVDPSPEALA